MFFISTKVSNIQVMRKAFYRKMLELDGSLEAIFLWVYVFAFVFVCYKESLKIWSFSKSDYYFEFLSFVGRKYKGLITLERSYLVILLFFTFSLNENHGDIMYKEDIGNDNFNILWKNILYFLFLTANWKASHWDCIEVN